LHANEPTVVEHGDGLGSLGLEIEGAWMKLSDMHKVAPRSVSVLALLLGVGLASAQSPPAAPPPAASAPAASGSAQPPPPSQDASLRTRFTGDFRFAGGTAEEDARERAIAQGTSGLFFAIRGIARSKVRDRTRIAPWLKLDFPNQQIRSIVPEAPPAISPGDGSAATYAFGNESLILTQRFVGDRLVQWFRGRDGSRQNDYQVAPDGKTLKIWVRVESPKLTSPVVYSLTYVKQ
jgi:hypothetical protein